MFTSQEKSSVDQKDQKDQHIQKYINEKEYPIIWYDPDINLKRREILKIQIQENNSITLFSRFQEAFPFVQALGTGFLLIIPNEFEQQIVLNNFGALKDMYGRKCFDFEQEAVLTSLFNEIPKERTKSLEVYVFFTRQDFLNEAPVSEEEEEVMVMCDVKEMAKRFRQEFTIFWCDPNFRLETKEILQNEFDIPEENIYRNFDDLLKKLANFHELPYHLILSGKTNPKTIVNKIDDFEDLLCLYIYDFPDGRFFEEKSSKIKIEKTLEELIPIIREGIRTNTKLKNLYPGFAPNFDDWDKSHINKVHYYLKGLTTFKNRRQAKKDFINLARKIYESKTLVEFEDQYSEYNKGQILSWYARDSPIYRLVNNCLRVATPDSILYSRLILKDMERAIREEYQQQSKNYNGVVYRGSYMSADEWEKLEKNVGKELEMNCFLSTSKSLRIAQRFVLDDATNRALITIIIPSLPLPESDEQGFACLSQYSDFAHEEEILFNVRSRFQVLNAQNVRPNQKYRSSKHLILLYRAQLIREYMTNQNPGINLKLKLSLEFKCNHCQSRMNLFAYTAVTGETQMICRECFISTDSVAENNILLPIGEKTELNQDKSISLDVAGKMLEFGIEAKLIYENSFKCNQCLRPGKGRFYKWINLENENIIRECLECFQKNKENRSGYLLLSEKENSVFWNTFQEKWEKVDSDLRAKEFKELNGCSEAAIFYKAQDYEKCEKFCRKSLQNLARKKNKEQEKMASLMYLAESSKWIGGYQKTLEFSLEALDIRRFIYGEAHPDTAASYNNLGMIYHTLGSHQKALKYHTRALDIRKLIKGEAHPETSASYNNLASIYESVGEYEKALEFDLKALEIGKALYGEEHPCTAASYSNLGMIYHTLGKYQKALEYQSKALNIRKSLYGESHPDTAGSYNNLATMYERLGRCQEALEYYLKALDIRKSIYGETHPSTATSYNNLGMIYHSLGEYGKALEYYSKALDIRKSIYGEAHPDIAGSYNNIGSVEKTLGKNQKALEYYSKALGIMRLIYGEAHPDIAISYNNLGMVYHALNKDKKALEYFMKTLDIQKSVYGEEHLRAATSYHNIAQIYNRQREYHKAFDFSQKALDIHRLILGENHSETATSYYNLAKVENHLRNHQKAFEHHLKALKIRKHVFGESHPETAASYHHLAKVYHHFGDHQKALNFNLKALEIRKSKYGEAHPITATSYQNLAQVYQTLGDDQQMSKWGLKASDIFKSVPGEAQLQNVPSDKKIAAPEKEQQTLQQILENSQETSNSDKLPVRKDDTMKDSEKLDNFEQAENSKSNSTHDSPDSSFRDDQLENEFESKDLPFAAANLIFKDEHSEIPAFPNPSRSKQGDMKEEQKPTKNEFYISSLKQSHEIEKSFDITTNRELALECENLGNFQRAIEYHLKALEMIISIYGEMHSEVSTSYRNLALMFNKLGDHQKALDYLFKAIAIQESIDEKDEEILGNLYNNLALVYESLGENNEAYEYHTKALNTRKSIYGENHLRTAASYNNLALLCEDMEKDQEARDYHKHVLEIRKHIYKENENHPDIATSYANLATVFRKLEQYQESLEHQEKALQIMRAYNPERKLPIGTMDLDTRDWPEASGENQNSIGFLMQSILIDKHYQNN